MAAVTPTPTRATEGRTAVAPPLPEEKGTGWLLFAGIMISLAGILNVIWGIAAVADSKFFVGDTEYILSGLNTWGWVAIVIGALQLFAAFSVWRGGMFGKWFGIIIAGLSAIAMLMSIPAYPFWSLSIFAIDVLVIYGLAVYGGRRYGITS